MGYRILFAVAAVYNVAFGLWAALFPLSFFSLFELEPPRYPSIWACLGMVVGLYGLVYAWVAWKPERGDVLIGIGLLGKVLGPSGWLVAVAAGELPSRTFPLVLLNDLVWWFPFLLYLLRDARWRGRIVAWTALILNGAASAALLLVRDGTEWSAEITARAAYVAAHPALWTTAWSFWSLASLSLLAFFWVWAERLGRLGARTSACFGACLLCFAGVLFDLSGETVNIVRLTTEALSLEDFASDARLYALLGPGLANGLYCLGGLVLSTQSWRVGFLRGWLGGLGFVMWTVGLGLTLAAVADMRPTMVVSGGLVMALFLVWVGILGRRMGPSPE
jgi:hypothetical protein